MSRIHLLDDRLIGQIAAGEVVERPASVVKELVENALDAGAREVAVELEGGGKRRIVVSDDGSGMDSDDALLAFDRHATSKIAGFADLERVATLGFRGEALATVAAVARVELRTAETPGDGTRVRIEGGRVKAVEPVAHPRGTRIEVESLFWNVPARRKFMKQPATELRRAVEVVHGYALARPEVRFSVTHEERTLLDAVPAGDPADGRDDEPGLRERIGQVFGGETADGLVAVPADSWAGSARVRGFVGGPTTSRGKRFFVFVNRRLVRDRGVLAAFYRAVREEWRSDDAPSLFLFLDVPPEEVDVNVHPQKAEVRFRDPHLADKLGDVLRRTLALARGEEAAPFRVAHELPRIAPAWEGLGGFGSGFGSGGKVRPDEGGTWRPVDGSSQPGEVREPSTPWDAPSDAPRTGEDAPSIARLHLAPLPERAPVPLSGRSGEERPFRLLGQYKGTLLLLEGPDGLYLVDQHVAHERILYERLRRTLDSARPASQTFLSPPLLELGRAEAMRLEEMAPALESAGFVVQAMGGGSVALTAAPAVLDVAEAAALVGELATAEGEPEVEGPALRRRLLDALAASLACRGAIKMHHPLPPAAMEALVSELFRAENPYACPHGRPTILQMSDAELERRFGRR